jgi:hypothetical protein
MILSLLKELRMCLVYKKYIPKAPIPGNLLEDEKD